ncbi:hypothetical protein [Parachitinimonas caeni]|uniref:Uncharacterized protein n=1 Tax=Parachitinimonas caeni TaxID=3031301 RepID=A0ABT7E617_9NEIS|nr:hypothetical protein [Parachitinimonas caeni]MDK2126803.1 hypothetical protein [Parachitinimonas caeni]
MTTLKLIAAPNTDFSRSRARALLKVRGEPTAQQVAQIEQLGAGLSSLRLATKEMAEQGAPRELVTLALGDVLFGELLRLHDPQQAASRLIGMFEAHANRSLGIWS